MFNVYLQVAMTSICTLEKRFSTLLSLTQISISFFLLTISWECCEQSHDNINILHDFVHDSLSNLFIYLLRIYLFVHLCYFWWELRNAFYDLKLSLKLLLVRRNWRILRKQQCNHYLEILFVHCTLENMNQYWKLLTAINLS